MRHSKRLVVLWSAPYFTRLWCAYELASWIYLGKSDICFMPVSIAVFTAILTLGLFVHSVLTTLCEAVVGEVPLRVALPCLWLFCVLLATLARHHVNELGQLSHQLTHFSVRGAHCFCCDAGHLDPETHEAMPCDRQLVYRALDEWFAKRSHDAKLPELSELSCLDFFDDQVRRLVYSHLSSLGAYRLSYANAVISNSPLVWFFVSRAAYLETQAWMEWLRYALYVGSLLFAALPTGYQTVIECCGYFERVFVGCSESWLLKALSTATSAFSMFCISGFLWLLVFLPFTYIRSPLPLMLVSVFLGVLTWFVFQGRYLHAVCRSKALLCTNS
eukprot:CAMPEP_0170586360 /NCGR_PEP_ID=MMETSP0224-20130122/9708_1 /TAXON_ID=285029 /ORGANISM="Togula jolla, Strain CCCM 725" /LENGTH=330 /DNA_ID=CAMNT_0010909911 /DNA_START=178 /DNA_END=1170 /DNA_ORIENTATION=-